jgi:hypothetical protein
MFGNLVETEIFFFPYVVAPTNQFLGFPVGRSPLSYLAPIPSQVRGRQSVSFLWLCLSPLQIKSSLRLQFPKPKLDLTRVEFQSAHVLFRRMGNLSRKAEIYVSKSIHAIGFQKSDFQRISNAAWRNQLLGKCWKTSGECVQGSNNGNSILFHFVDFSTLR